MLLPTGTLSRCSFSRTAAAQVYAGKPKPKKHKQQKPKKRNTSNKSSSTLYEYAPFSSNRSYQGYGLEGNLHAKLEAAKSRMMDGRVPLFHEEYEAAVERGLVG